MSLDRGRGKKVKKYSIAFWHVLLYFFLNNNSLDFWDWVASPPLPCPYMATRGPPVAGGEAASIYIPHQPYSNPFSI